MEFGKTSFLARLSWRFVQAGCAFFWILGSAHADGNRDVRNTILDRPVQERGTAGSLRVAGAYPFEAPAYTVAALPSGDVLVYGVAPLETEGLDSEKIKRALEISSIGGLHQEPLWWNARVRGWKKTEMPPECPRHRLLHTMTALPNGKILVAGGLCNRSKTAGDKLPLASSTALSLWNGVTEKWEPVSASLSVLRIFHTASLLKDGSVLLAGGEVEFLLSEPGYRVLGDVELYRDGKTSPLPPLHVPRARHTATLLTDGSLMIAGGAGQDGKALYAVEIWDPGQHVWRDGPPLKTARYRHSATLLADGRVIVTGGQDMKGEPLASVEIWDPALQTWSNAAPLPYPLRNHTAARLSNGDLLVSGGQWNRDNPPGRVLLWDHAAERWRPAGLTQPEMNDKNFPAITLAPGKDGSAMIFGRRRILQWLPGDRANSPAPPYGERDLFATTVLADGRVMITGGRVTNLISHQYAPPMSDASEIFDPKSARFSITGRMNQTRIMHSMLALGDGNAVVAGGWVWQRDQPGVPVANYPEVWNPATGKWSMIDEIRFKPQEWVNLGKLKDGRVLFFASDESTRADTTGQAAYRAWLWDPKTGHVEKKPVAAKPHSSAAIAILQDGRVLRVGGNIRTYLAGHSCSSLPVNADASAETGTCDNEAGQWDDHMDTTAEIWDSRSGEVTQLAPPPNWKASEGKSLALRNGDALFVEHLPARFGRNASLPHAAILLWSARDGGWRHLPELPSDENWPMLEREDGTLWTAKHYLPPGEESWRDTPALIQDNPAFTQLPSGELLALSTQPPHAALLDGTPGRWLARLAKDAQPGWLAKPAAVVLADGRIMAIGRVERTNLPMPSAYIWNLRDNSWHTVTPPSHPLGRAAQAVLLTSGHVLYTSIGKENQLNCEIWRSENGKWQLCDSPIMTGAFATAPGLGLLEDGRAVVVADTSTAYVFDENSMRWTSMKGSWNGEFLTHGIAVRQSKPLQQIFDESRNMWYDTSGVAARYWEQANTGERFSPAYSQRTAQIQEPRYAAPSMLWNTKKKEWTYLFSQGDMGPHAQLLPDGCAFSWRPLGLFNPATGNVSKLADPGIGMTPDNSTMLILADGRAIFMGMADDIPGPGLFQRKISCSGFEAQPGDDALIPPWLASEKALPAPAQHVVAPLPWWTTALNLIQDYRWIALAVIGPILLYLLLRKVILPRLRRDATRILPRHYINVLKQKLPSSYASTTRIAIYGLLLIFVIPNLVQVVRFKLSGSKAACEESPRACLDKKSGILRSVPTLENRILFFPLSSPKIPCRYLGVWTSRHGSKVLLATLKDDGTYIMTEPTGSAQNEGPTYTGYWMAQGNHLVWRHNNAYMPDLDINKIVSDEGKIFELAENDGSHTQFELVQAANSSSCSR